MSESARITPSPFEGEGWDGGWAAKFGTHAEIERRTPTLTLPLTGGGNINIKALTHQNQVGRT
jgi:hypothetical protein